MAYPYRFTPELVRDLQVIERARTQVELTVLPPVLAAGIRLNARLRSVHFSACIEGHPLTLNETEQAILENRAFPGREQDCLDARQSFQALEQVEAWVEEDAPFSEERIRKLHAIQAYGKHSRPTPYREAEDGAADAPARMTELAAWIQQDLPAPILAGMAHYQLAAIQPFSAGSRSTARALAAWILRRGGYALGGFAALEEAYAQDLPGYEQALLGSAPPGEEADVTPWLGYFLKGMAGVFENTAQQVRSQVNPQDSVKKVLLPKLDRQGRIVLGLFARQNKLTASDVAHVLGLSARQSEMLLVNWVAQGWIEIDSASRKTRDYRLASVYRRNASGEPRKRRLILVRSSKGKV